MVLKAMRSPEKRVKKEKNFKRGPRAPYIRWLGTDKRLEEGGSGNPENDAEKVQLVR